MSTQDVGYVVIRELDPSVGIDPQTSEIHLGHVEKKLAVEIASQYTDRDFWPAFVSVKLVKRTILDEGVEF